MLHLPLRLSATPTVALVRSALCTNSVASIGRNNVERGLSFESDKYVFFIYVHSCVLIKAMHVLRVWLGLQMGKQKTNEQKKIDNSNLDCGKVY